KRSGPDIGQVMTSELDERRVLHRAAFLIELLFFPSKANVRIRALFQKLSRQFERSHIAGRRRRAMWRIADAGSAVRAWLPQPGQRVQRRSARIRGIRVSAVIEKDGREFEVRVHD